MSVFTQVPLGAPGLYAARPTLNRRISGARMDVCAFVGVAPRGPARVPVIDERWRDDRPCVESGRPRRRTVAVAVNSFDEYRAIFGGFEGPGRLPYAVAAFFANGGQRAWVARIVHEYGDPVLNAGRVASAAPGGLLLRARSEGNWGKAIQARLSYSATPLAFLTIALDTMETAAGQTPPVGSLLRLTFADGTRLLRFLVSSDRLSVDRTRWTSRFESPLPQLPVRAEVVEAVMDLDDGLLVRERHGSLGLAPEHPRWVATVLCYESALAWPDESWIALPFLPASASLDTPPAVRFDSPDDLDDYAAITHEDFFDASWTLGDDEPGAGIHCLALNTEIAQVTTPDLYSPGALAPIESVLNPVSLAGPEFAPCVIPAPPGEQAAPAASLDGLLLDPLLPADLAQITALQLRVVDFADKLRNFAVLLDVPPGIDQKSVLSWRASFDSTYAAAYHPWVLVSRDDDNRDARVLAPPSGFAAGVIASTEALFGIPHGPANRTLAGALDLGARVSPAQHGELHPQSVNVLTRGRDGVTISAARTLSSDPRFRQLSVRRLMLMLRRTLDREMQWVVFEPNNASLRRELSQMLRAFLRRLFDQGAFAPADPASAFFVRCDDALNPAYVLDQGRLITEIGVAPSEPIEFIVLRLEREGDGSLRIEE
jgi:hypothetical protein